MIKSKCFQVLSEPVSFFVSGNPVPQPRPRFTIRNGISFAYTPKSSPINAWKQTILIQARQQSKIDCGSLFCELLFVLKRPKYHFKKNILIANSPFEHSTKPDIDNLVKAVLDALMTSNTITDDSKICSLKADKIFENDVIKQGVFIRLKKFEPIDLLVKNNLNN